MVAAPSGLGMYFLFFCDGNSGICIALGYMVTVIALLLLRCFWTGVYLMQKTRLTINQLLSIDINCNNLWPFGPLIGTYSLDTRRNPSLKANKMSACVKRIIGFCMLFIVVHRCFLCQVVRRRIGWILVFY